MDPRIVARVLSEIAEIASETLELQEVFDRVATSVRTLIPFDNMGVVRFVDAERAVVHASTVPCKTSLLCSEPIPLTAWSPRMRPHPGPSPRIDDAQVEFDPSYAIDAQALAGGVRSGMWEPFQASIALRGGVWLCSYEPRAFTDEHQEVLRPIAALLGSAVEHWRIWDSERRRRERLDHLEEVLGALAESLDVREVFDRISAAVQPVLPHHLLALTELDDRSRTFRVVTFAGESDGPEPTEPIPLDKEQDLEKRLATYEIIDDIVAEIAPVTVRNRLLLSTGMRSLLRVPVRLWGEVRGSLVFFHREPQAFVVEDAEVAGRFADRIALAICHHRLAEEGRIAAEAREQAERLAATVETLTQELESRGRGRIVGTSHPWKDVLLQVARVASSETTVLITGESGTGKEVVSHLIHQGSPHSGKPFVAINCAALPEQLLESELFGHEKGAFTGAIATKIGRIEQAAGGTLFLDEIGEMSPAVQAKFLRVLQEREFQRVGGTRTIQADVRVIAATNRDLSVAITRQEFREDLYYRLNVFEIPIPPLRERPDDILPLAEVFLEELGRTIGRPAAGISREAREWLLSYQWPGNVRELRNAIERAILLCDGGLIARAHLPTPPRNGHAAASKLNGWPDPETPLPPGGVDLEAMDRGFVEAALRDSAGNKSRAARLLGLTRAQLYTRLEKYGLGTNGSNRREPRGGVVSGTARYVR
jgi:transcriptional regulator with GAF, ATPase, and Fis domain